MSRVFDVLAILILVAFFLLGLLGSREGEGIAYLQIVLAVLSVLAIGWLAQEARHFWRRLFKNVRAWRVARTKDSLRGSAVPDLDSAYEALRNKDWRMAANGLWAAAESGDGVAQYYLSHLFRIGKGVPRSPEEGFRWLSRAATNQVLDAEAEIGRALMTGYYGAIEKDYEKALAWLTQAAERGHDGAKVDIGTLYERGLGVRKDPQLAASWYRRAAERGHLPAQYALGRLYLGKKGGLKDPVQASLWLRLAAERLSPDQQQRYPAMASALQHDLAHINISLAPAQAAESRALQREWSDRLREADPEYQAEERKRRRERVRIATRPFTEKLRDEFDRLRDEASHALPSPEDTRALPEPPKRLEPPRKAITDARSEPAERPERARPMRDQTAAAETPPTPTSAPAADSAGPKPKPESKPEPAPKKTAADTESEEQDAKARARAKAKAAAAKSRSLDGLTVTAKGTQPSANKPSTQPDAAEKAAMDEKSVAELKAELRQKRDSNRGERPKPGPDKGTDRRRRDPLADSAQSLAEQLKREQRRGSRGGGSEDDGEGGNGDNAGSPSAKLSRTRRK